MTNTHFWQWLDTPLSGQFVGFPLFKLTHTPASSCSPCASPA